jgi:hypothetical protein
MNENLNLQIIRRTLVIGFFTNEKSVLMETSEEGETGKSYLTFTASHSLEITTS